jgi:hypothetical protein
MSIQIPKPDSHIRSPHSLSLLVSLGLSGSVDVADISGNTGSTPDIVKAQPSDQRVGLEQQRQGLTDSTTGTEDGDLSLGTSGGGEGSGRSSESRSGEHFV